MDIQSQIDDLFSPTPEVVEEPQQEVIEEQTKKPEYERVVLSDDLFGDVSSTDLVELTEELEEVSEAIDIKKADMGEVIKDFRQSDAPQFKGKSKKKKQQMAIAAKLNTESYEERLMNTVMSQITKNAKNENLQLKEVPELNEERIKNIETQLIQVRQLFHEATMVSGIGQGGDGQTPGSGEVKLTKLDDVDLEAISQGDTIIWNGNQFVPGTGSGSNSEAVAHYRFRFALPIDDQSNDLIDDGDLAIFGDTIPPYVAPLHQYNKIQFPSYDLDGRYVGAWNSRITHGEKLTLQFDSPNSSNETPQIFTIRLGQRVSTNTWEWTRYDTHGGSGTYPQAVEGGSVVMQRQLSLLRNGDEVFGPLLYLDDGYWLNPHTIDENSDPATLVHKQYVDNLELEDLRNVDGTPSNGDLIIYDNGNWNVGKLKDEDIVISDPSTINDAGNVLDQAGANAYFGSTLEGHEDRIDALENATIPGTFLGVIDATDPLNEPPDTSVLNKGDYYIHDGATGTLWGSTELDAETVENGNQIIWDGTNWMVVSTVTTLAQLGDTDVDSAETGDLLVYNEVTSIWESQTVPIPTVTVGAVQPDTGNEEDGDFWYDTNNDILYIYDSGWKVVRARPKVYTTGEPPVDASEGELYFDSGEEELTLYIRYNGDWVPAAPPVSTEGIESNLRLLNEAVQGLQATASSHTLQIADAQSTQYGLAQAAAVTAQNVQELQESQEVQDEKLNELEAAVEDLRPSVERGEWLYNSAPINTSVPAVGEYVAKRYITAELCSQTLNECLLENVGDQAAQSQCNRDYDECLLREGEYDTDVTWPHVQYLVFNKKDSGGTDHAFGDVLVGMYVEMINVDGSGHGLYLIDAKSVGTIAVTLTVHGVHSSGHPTGLAHCKIFSMSQADPVDYVRKAGDTMTGALNINVNDGNAAYIRSGATTGSSIFYVRNGSDRTLFRVKGDGGVQAGPDADNPFIAAQANDLTTKKYVDDAANSLFRVVEVSTTSELESGDICFTLSDEYVYLSYKTLSGRIWPSPVTSDNDLPWPQGIDVSSTAGTGRNVPDIFFAYEDPELNRPMGMSSVKQVSWPRWADANGNPRGASGNTHYVKFKYGTSYYNFRTRPPVGTILRVRFAPWL